MYISIFDLDFAACPHNTLSKTTPHGRLLLHVKRNFEDLAKEKFLFTVVKRNLLNLKMNKQTNK